jgi:enamine deaminase RidA (YjgF/YER057c/UK114 family)
MLRAAKRFRAWFLLCRRAGAARFALGHRLGCSGALPTARYGDRRHHSKVCENLKAAVEAGGGTMNDICRVDVYVRNIEQFEAIHKVRREYFKAPLPASTMVEVTKMVSPDYLIEINAIVVIP